MSVKRYTNGADDDQGTILPFMEESPNGDYVEYADYARLKAEVERLTEANDCLDKMHEKEMARSAYLCEQVERLRKAGDAMQDAVETYFELLPMLVNEVRAKAMLKGRKAIKEWNAAKEGKQSEEVLWVQLEDYEKLKAENERLRKAGDELYDWAGAEDCPQRVYDAWNAAKEGKPQS